MAVPSSAYIKTPQPRLEVPREKLGCADSLPLWGRSTEKGIFPSKYEWPSLWMPQQHLQFLTPALGQKQPSPALLMPTSEALATFLRNIETGSPACLILVATSHTVSASRAGCDIPVSGPLQVSSAQDGRAVPKLMGVSSYIHMVQLSAQLLILYCPSYCRVVACTALTVWPHTAQLEMAGTLLPLLFPPALSKISGERGSFILCISAVVDMSLGKDTVLNNGWFRSSITALTGSFILHKSAN